MDPIGTLGFALHAVRRLIELVKTIRDAPEEVHKLQLQAALVGAFLDHMRSIMQHGEEHIMPAGIEMNTVVEHGQELRNDVEAFLGKVSREGPLGMRRLRKHSYLIRSLICGPEGQNLQDSFRNFLTLIIAVNLIRCVQIAST